jgi:hypothetical protein
MQPTGYVKPGFNWTDTGVITVHEFRGCAAVGLLLQADMRNCRNTRFELLPSLSHTASEIIYTAFAMSFRQFLVFSVLF